MIRRRRRSSEARSRATRIGVALLLLLPPLSIGCRSLGIREERELGRKLAMEVRRTLPLLRDRTVDEFVTEMGLALVEASGPQPFRYHFSVIVDPDINAFCGPGGHVYVNTGALLAAGTVDELAALLAHEIGHGVLRHPIKKKDVIWQTRYREKVREEQRKAHVNTIEIGSGTSAGSYLNRYSQEYEMEADRFAVPVLHRTGYDPEALVLIVKTAVRQTASSSAGLAATHPPVYERIRAMYEQIAELPPGPRPTPPVPDRLAEIQERIGLLTVAAPP